MKILMMMIHLLCFLQSSFFTFAILDPIDFLSLQLIQNSLADSPGSNYFSSWDFTSDPYNFPGVYCDSDKIIALNLSDPSAGSPSLTGRLHPAIKNLSSLSKFIVVFLFLPSSLSKFTFIKNPYKFPGNVHRPSKSSRRQLSLLKMLKWIEEKYEIEEERDVIKEEQLLGLEIQREVFWALFILGYKGRDGIRIEVRDPFNVVFVCRFGKGIEMEVQIRLGLGKEIGMEKVEMILEK